MKALQYQGPGNLEWIDAPDPVLEDENDVIARPLAVATCDLDWQIISGKTPFPPPFILGHEFVAEVLSVGGQVEKFTPGDRVSVAFQPSCGCCSSCHIGESSACKSVPPTSMFGVGAVSGGWGGAFAERIRIPFADNMLIHIPQGKPVTWFPSASDNIADGFRTVGGFLRPGNSNKVLIFGSYDSIPLYAVAFARALGVDEITFCTKSEQAANNAHRLGASTELVKEWPQRLPAHDITVCAIENPEVLVAAIRSTKAGGHCTSTSIFMEDVSLPLREMYMRGISFHTGRVNGAHINATAVNWIQSGLIEPLQVDTRIVTFADLLPALQARTAAKLIATPE